nr:PREDICTED: ammonium transporter Rh type A isoform X1 [Bemisia tabaci]
MRYLLALMTESFFPAAFLVAVELVMMLLYMAFVHYDPRADAFDERNNMNPVWGGFKRTKMPTDNYTMFQDINVMIFIGFGFLMTFLRKYAFSAISFTLLISAITIQWAILCHGFYQLIAGERVIRVGISQLVEADVAAAAVLISMGAVLGKTTVFQLIFMALVETALYVTNLTIGIDHLQAADVGGSIFVHAFGAYFGIAVALALGPPMSTEDDESTYVTDIFAMIGTVFLWMFWPSFNAVLSDGDEQYRIVINTYLALTASCIVCFCASSIVSPRNKFTMVHIQNATLAGGVAIGAASNMMTLPWGALAIGGLGGFLSVISYQYLQPMLLQNYDLHDTCGVHNLHGLPGVFGGCASALLASLASVDDYSSSLYLIFPARAPFEDTFELNEAIGDLPQITAGKDRTALNQAGIQLLATVITVAIASLGGTITGLLMRSISTKLHDDEEMFQDETFWGLPPPALASASQSSQSLVRCSN